MNAIPTTRKELRLGLAAEVEKSGVLLTPKPFWQQNHKYCSKPEMQQGDLWLYEHRAPMKVLIDILKDGFEHIKFEPAVTDISAEKARLHLQAAYGGDEGNIRTFLTETSPYLNTIIQILCRQEEPKPTPQIRHRAIQALIVLEGLLSKQPLEAVHA